MKGCKGKASPYSTLSVYIDRFINLVGSTAVAALLVVYTAIAAPHPSHRAGVDTTSPVRHLVASSQLESTLPVAQMGDPSLPTDPSVIDQFFVWLNLCVSGQLDSVDPGCKQAAYDIAGLGYGATDIATCANSAAEAIRSGNAVHALDCLGPAAGALWQYYQNHNSGG